MTPGTLPTGRRLIGAAILASVTLTGGHGSLAAAEVRGCDDPGRTSRIATTASPPQSSPAVEPDGFLTVPGHLTGGADEAVDLCLWLADAPALHQRGLMGVTDLGNADGMLFVFDAPTSAEFYMWQTPLPLSIAFFDESGRLVDGADMTPCLDDDPDGCQRYRSELPYVMALEVGLGSLAEHLTRGARLTVDLSATEGTETLAPHWTCAELK